MSKLILIIRIITLIIISQTNLIDFFVTSLWDKIT